jgi:uncharacterized glyoxalase superfamily protein PhnB
MGSTTESRLTASAPVLLVKDVVTAANHYRDAMGFSYDKFWGEPPWFVILGRDGMYIMLKRAADPKDIVPHWTVSDVTWNMYFWVNDVDRLYAEFVRRGAKIDYGLRDQPYGCREFGTQDLDGYDIGFGQIIHTPANGTARPIG